MRQPEARPRRGWTMLLFSAIVLGIFQSHPEISTAIEEGGIDYSIYTGPLWIKLIKDLFIAGLWLYLVLCVADPFPRAVRRAVAACYAMTLVAFGVAFVTQGPLIALSGLRWILAVFVFLELRRLYGRTCDPRRVTTLLLILLSMNLGLQLMRLAYFPPVWGEHWGLPARVPGFFLLPNTNAMFAMACTALVIDLQGRTHQAARLALALALLSAVVSQSVGGLMAGVVLFLYMIFGRLRYILPFAVLIGALLLGGASNWLGREDFLEYSGGSRVEKLLQAAGELTGIGAFGAYTNTGFMLVQTEAVWVGGDREPVISDSFYVSVVGNFGLLAIPLALAFWHALRRASRAVRGSGRSLGKACLICLIVFGFSTVLSEVFPMALMLSIGVWIGWAARRPVPRSCAAPQQSRPLSLPPEPQGAPT